MTTGMAGLTVSRPAWRRRRSRLALDEARRRFGRKPGDAA